MWREEGLSKIAGPAANKDQWRLSANWFQRGASAFPKGEKWKLQ